MKKQNRKNKNSTPKLEETFMGNRTFYSDEELAEIIAVHIKSVMFSCIEKYILKAGADGIPYGTFRVAIPNKCLYFLRDFFSELPDSVVVRFSKLSDGESLATFAWDFYESENVEGATLKAYSKRIAALDKLATAV